jgi:hypothetical protein
MRLGQMGTDGDLAGIETTLWRFQITPREPGVFQTGLPLGRTRALKIEVGIAVMGD